MMNALTLNLLAEEQLAYQQRARDPLKAAIAIGVALMALTAGIGVILSIQAVARETAVSEMQGKLDALLSAGVVAGEDAFRDTDRLAGDVRTINQSRVLCAPELAVLKDLVPPSVQLTHISFAMSMESDALLPAVVGAGNRAAGPKTSERLVVQLDGRALGASPELEVDRFLQTMRSHPAFSQAVESIQLLSIARAPVMAAQADASAPSSLFVIDCQYKERP
ncbi:hypothetical protein HQ590_09710 [bacterium]|nr:hypothetical protein [bacterium]